MKHSVMKKQNWVLLVGSMLLMYLGFILMRLITRNYDGILAFVTTIMAIGGIVGVIVSLSVDFNKSDTPEAQE